MSVGGYWRGQMASSAFARTAFRPQGTVRGVCHGVNSVAMRGDRGYLDEREGKRTAIACDRSPFVVPGVVVCPVTGLGVLEVFACDIPIDDAPNGFQVGWALVLILEIVGMLPDIDAKDGGLAI